MYMEFVSFEQYYTNYYNDKHFGNYLRRNAADCLYIRRSVGKHLLENKTEEQIKFINLYETYAIDYLEAYMLDSVYDKYITYLNENVVSSYNYDITEATSKNDNYDLIYDKSNDLVKNKCNGVLYHITLGCKYNKIQNKGLIPRSGNKKSEHPERIYFYPSNMITANTKEFKHQAEYLYKQSGEYSRYAQQYVTDKGLEICILKIDLYKYPLLHYRFFYDPNHSRGVFTYEPVHPVCVELVESFYI